MKDSFLYSSLLHDTLITKRRSSIESEIAIENKFSLELEFAFYLYVNEIRVQTSWYSNKNRVSFDVSIAEGVYQVLGFVRIKGYDTVLSNRSKALLVTEAEETVKKRYIRLKEWPVSSITFKEPTDDYISKAEGLEKKKYKIQTCPNGFMLTKSAAMDHECRDAWDKWVFLGASFVESLFVEDGFRFTDCLERQLQEEGRKKYFLNGGYSGATTLHSLNIFLNKVLPLAPEKLFFSVCAHNDSNAIRFSRTYWSEDNLKSSIIPSNIKESQRDKIETKDLGVLLHILKESCRVSGVELYLGTIPFRKNIDDIFIKSRYPNIKAFLRAVSNRSVVNDYVRDWSYENQVPLIDVDKEMSGFEKFSMDELHMNAAGSKKFSDILFKYMR